MYCESRSDWMGTVALAIFTLFYSTILFDVVVIFSVISGHKARV